MTFGERLKETRESLGITQLKLGKMTKISKGRIYELEKHKNINPSMATLKEISLSLGKSIDYFVFGKPSPRYNLMQYAFKELSDEEQFKIMNIVVMWAKDGRSKK